LSGKSNIIFWLEKQGIQPTEELVEKIFAGAKHAGRLLRDGNPRALRPTGPLTSSPPAILCLKEFATPGGRETATSG
jgi:hypothetical protein